MKQMIIAKDVPSSTKGRSEMDPRGTVMVFESALPVKWAGIRIKIFGGALGRDAITCDGNDAGSRVGLSTSVARIVSRKERKQDFKRSAHEMFYTARMQ